MSAVIEIQPKTITITLENQGITRKDPEVRIERALSYLVSSTESLKHITVQGDLGCNFREIYSRQITSADDFTQDLAARLNGNSRHYYPEGSGNSFTLSKKAKREQAVQLNIQKYLDAYEKGIDFTSFPSQVRNIIVCPNTQETREKNLYYLDQVLALFKHFSPLEQMSKSNRKD